MRRIRLRRKKSWRKCAAWKRAAWRECEEIHLRSAAITQKAEFVNENIARIDRELERFRMEEEELKSGVVVFVGGGSIRLRRQIEASGKVGKALFVDDIQANAKGFEKLYQYAVNGR